MASSGSFTTSKYMNLSIMFEWSVKSQSIDGNSSVIAWSIKGYRTDGAIGMITCGNFTVTINGATVYSTGRYDRIDVYNGTVVASGETTIAHDSDGSKKFDVYVAAAIYYGDVTSTGTQQFALPTIPRKSSLSASNGTLGTAQTLTVDRKSSSFTHTITYSCGNTSGTICTKSSSTSISWIPPLSLAEQNTTGTSVTVKFTITTYNGNTNIGTDTKNITCAIPSSVKPSCSLAVSDPTGNATKYGGYIKGVSKINGVITATPAYGSAVDSYSATANGTRYTGASFTTDVLKTAGTQNVVATVTDKRKRSGSATASITVLDYAPPSVTALSVHRCNADGTANEQGEYVKVTFSGKVTSLSNKNIARYTVEYKKTADPDYTAVALTDYNDNYSAAGINYIFAADTGSSYDVRVTVADAFGDDPKTTSASTGFTLMHWKADGTAVGIGKVAEKDHTLDMGVNIELNDNDIYKNGVKAFAPYGYGYGGQSVALKNNSLIADEDDLDNELAKIYDAMNAGETKMITFFGYPSNSDWRFFGILSKSSASNGSLIAHSAYGAGSKIIKQKYGGTWQPCEWENPPMVAGVEYRTTERCDGKPVYRKLVVYTHSGKFGDSATNTDYTIPHGISDWVRSVRCVTSINNEVTGSYLGSVGGILCVNGFGATNINVRVYKTYFNSPIFRFDLAYIKK